MNYKIMRKWMQSEYIMLIQSPVECLAPLLQFPSLQRPFKVYKSSTAKLLTVDDTKHGKAAKKKEIKLDLQIIFK